MPATETTAIRTATTSDRRAQDLAGLEACSRRSPPAHGQPANDVSLSKTRPGPRALGPMYCVLRSLAAPAAPPAKGAKEGGAGAEQEPEVVPVPAPRLVVERELLPAAEHVNDEDYPGRKAVPQPPQQVRPLHDDPPSQYRRDPPSISEIRRRRRRRRLRNLPSGTTRRELPKTS